MATVGVATDTGTNGVTAATDTGTTGVTAATGTNEVSDETLSLLVRSLKLFPVVQADLRVTGRLFPSLFVLLIGPNLVSGEDTAILLY